MLKTAQLSVIITSLLIPMGLVFADSPAELVRQGNAAYLAEKYDEALAAYEEASVEAPESPHLYFNKGTALYQKGDYAGAARSFEKAALKSRDLQIEAGSKFNLGNCAFREAERQQDGDLQKSLESCKKSIQYYQEALALDPDFRTASENIEVVRLVMKTLLDAINKQKEAQKQQQEANQKIAETLKELIEKQNDALNRNRQLEQERSRVGASPNMQGITEDLIQDQKDLQTETEGLAKDIPKPQNQNAPSQESPVATHLNNAVKEQQAASGNLGQQNSAAAEKNQEKAVEELKEALSALSSGQQCKPPDSQQQQKEGEGQKQQQSASADKQPEGNNDQEATAQMGDDARDILDEEKETKKQRRMQSAGGYRDVDKDW